MVKIVSLDFAGVIVSKKYIDYFWFEAIPKMYAKVRNIPLEEAKNFILGSYKRLSPNRVEWYLPRYWVKVFNLEEYLDIMLEESAKYIEVYDDVKDVLPRISSRCSIVVSTNTTREFIDLFIRRNSWIKHYIYKIYSCTSDFRLPRKTLEFYMMVINDLKVKPEDVLHVGDDIIYDYEVPSRLGIKVLLMDRSRRLSMKYHTVKNLYDVLEYIEKLLL